MSDKSSLKGVWSGHVNHLNFGEMTKATVFKFCTRVSYVKSQHMADNSPLK